MAIYANPTYFEREAEGHIEHVLVAVRYTGPNRWYANNSAHTQGRWPTDANFLEGIWYVGFVPEAIPQGIAGEGVAWFERNEHFDVAFDRATIARVILEYGGAELIPGGPIGEGDTLPGFDEKVRDALGLEPPHEAGKPEIDQLYDIADIDRTEGIDTRDAETVFVEDYGRDELKELVKETREDASEFSLRGASMHDMAAYLVEQGIEP